MTYDLVFWRKEKETCTLRSWPWYVTLTFTTLLSSVSPFSNFPFPFPTFASSQIGSVNLWTNINYFAWNPSRVTSLGITALACFVQLNKAKGKKRMMDLVKISENVSFVMTCHMVMRKTVINVIRTYKPTFPGVYLPTFLPTHLSTKYLTYLPIYLSKI